MITPLTNKINYGYGSNISDYRSNNISRHNLTSLLSFRT